jgi:hypothetical protein
MIPGTMGKDLTPNIIAPMARPEAIIAEGIMAKGIMAKGIIDGRAGI